jgi:hypothetical protein
MIIEAEIKEFSGTLFLSRIWHDACPAVGWHCVPISGVVLECLDLQQRVSTNNIGANNGAALENH